jgi:hypothetical protein
MRVTRRLFKRTATIEQVMLKTREINHEVSLTQNAIPEGGTFFLQIFRSDGTQHVKLFECDLRGRIEIECGPAANPGGSG